MKIKSSIHDYYDWVAHQYGGGDPNLVYMRDRIVPLGVEKTPWGTIHTEHGFTFPDAFRKSLSQYWDELGGDTPRVRYGSVYHFHRTECRMIVVCGRVYLVTRNGPVTREVTGFEEENFGPWQVHSEGTVGRDRSYDKWSIGDPGIELGVFNEDAYQLSRLVHAPVFEVQWKEIPARVPVLGELGFAAVIDATQMYQNIAYFLGLLNEDRARANMPPATQTDVDKAVSHGPVVGAHQCVRK
jgi:hypothetical protein